MYVVTKEEIFKTLMSLPTWKSTGLDGFNVEFYKIFWDDLGNQLFVPMKYFFDKGGMPNAWAKLMWS